MGSCLIVHGLSKFVFDVLYLLLYAAHLEPADLGTKEMIFILIEKETVSKRFIQTFFDPKEIRIWIFYPE